MILLEKELPLDHTIILTGDWHEGTVLKYQKVLDAVKEEVSRENIYVDINGDLAEAITIDDKRYCQDTDEGYSPLEQYQAVKDFLRPIRKKILRIGFGNHDYKLFRFGNMVRDLVCKDLEVSYGTYASKVIIKNWDGKIQYKIYITHGRKSINSTADDPIRRQANMELILKRHLKDQAADCAVMIKGHCHKLLSIHPTESLYLYDDGREIKSAYTADTEGIYIHPDLRYYGCSGSAYRLFSDPILGVSSYAEMAEYSPNELGYLRLIVHGGKPVKLEKVVIA